MSQVSTDQFAEYFAVVTTRSTGKVKSVFNPDYDWQLSAHRVDSSDEMRIFSKKEFGVPLKSNAMTQEMVARIVKTIEDLIGEK